MPFRSRSRVLGLPRDRIARLSPYAFFNQTFELTSDTVDQWSDESGNGRHWQPPGTSPDTIRYLFGGLRGVLNDLTLQFAVQKTFTRPWEVWFVISPGAAAASQDFLSNNAASDLLGLGTQQKVTMRIGAATKVLSPNNALVQNVPAVVRVLHRASGALECYIGGVEQAQGQSSTSDFSVRTFGEVAATSTSHLGAIVFFERQLTAAEVAIVQGELGRFLEGSIITVGASNTIDGEEGARALGGKRFPEPDEGYNSRPIFHASPSQPSWNERLGEGDQWTTTPWRVFRERCDTSNAQALHNIAALLCHVMIAGYEAGTEMNSNHQTMLSDVVGAARDELVSQGHFASPEDCAVYFSPMARYASNSTCGQLTDGNVALSEALCQWAYGGGIANALQGPTFPVITEERSDVGGPTSSCHVNEYAKRDDGRVLNSRFDALAL